jgi:hypothetical protein
MLHVRLSHNDVSLTTIGLVDSGSTTTFVPLELADILSLPIEREDRAVVLAVVLKTPFEELTLHS